MARVDRGAIAHNLSVARIHAQGAQVLAVVKANAYGHGLSRTWQSLRGADGLAVLEIHDAVLLRDAGYRGRILLLEGFFTADELPLIALHNLTPVIHNAEQVSMLKHAVLDARFDVFLKINSGMNRLGFSVAASADVSSTLRLMRCVREVVWMTHFADAEEVAGAMWQLQRLRPLLADQGPALRTSFANSAALLRHADARGDMVRPGIMLYGASPLDDRSAQSLDLRPAMTLHSALIGVQALVPGDTVGYGGRFRASKPMRIGVVACGYADGYPRHAPNGTPVLVEGVRTSTLGSVSMDLLCVDVSEIGHARVGSPVTLWGEGLPVEEVARAAGTVSYELLCALAPRVPVVEIAG